MQEPISARRRQFFERWALLNLTLLAAGFMVGGAYARYQPEGTQPNLVRLAFLAILLVVFPVNGLYLFGSASCHVQNTWREHRSYWLWLLVLGTAWTFATLGACAFASGVSE